MDEPPRPPKVVLGPGADDFLEWENWALLFVVHATQGCIGPEVLAISVQATVDAITVHLCLREDNDQVDEDVEELIASLEAAYDGHIGRRSTTGW